MLVSSEKDRIRSPLDYGIGSIKCLDDLEGNFPTQESPDLGPLPPICVDVDVVPEQKQCELQRMISSLEDEIAGLRQKQMSLHDKTREVLNQILDIKGSIRVFCRLRPYMLSERKSKYEPILAGSEKIVVRLVGSKKEFDFDKVFMPNSTQEDVFFEVKPILRSAVDGHNVCILAYGQTGTGKTFTMEGTNEQPGIVPRALKELFYLASLDKTESFTFSLSMLEVYMGNLKDLLAPRLSRRAHEAAPRCNLTIQTDPKGMVEIEGLLEVPIADFSKAIWWYNKGRRARSTSCTNVNDMSSRSHCLMRVTISGNHDAPAAGARITKLWMVDLGGSERLLKTGAIGQTLDEGRSINLSLSALGDVIAALRSRRSHVPYRNSKLTQILKDSLGDGSKVLMLVHVSPCDEDIGETICSLNFAKRARAIESNQELSKEMKQQKQKILADLVNQLREAEEEYQRVGNQIENANFLLGENKKLYLYNYPDVESQASKELEEVRETHQASENVPRRRESLPRFMTSTVASRERQSAAEKEINARQQALFRSTIRSSVQSSFSQSFLGNSNAKQRNALAHVISTRTNSPRGNDPGTNFPSITRNKAATSLNPNLGPPASRHRRRMSNLV